MSPSSSSLFHRGSSGGGRGVRGQVLSPPPWGQEATIAFPPPLEPKCGQLSTLTSTTQRRELMMKTSV